MNQEVLDILLQNQDLHRHLIARCGSDRRLPHLIETVNVMEAARGEPSLCNRNDRTATPDGRDLWAIVSARPNARGEGFTVHAVPAPTTFEGNRRRRDTLVQADLPANRLGSLSSKVIASVNTCPWRAGYSGYCAAQGFKRPTHRQPRSAVARSMTSTVRAIQRVQARRGHDGPGEGSPHELLEPPRVSCSILAERARGHSPSCSSDRPPEAAVLVDDRPPGGRRRRRPELALSCLAHGPNMSGACGSNSVRKPPTPSRVADIIQTVRHAKHGAI